MRRKLETMQRLATLYSVIEEMESAELERRTTVVRQTERALDAEQSAIWAAREEGRNALNAGDSMAWRISQTGLETASRRWKHLECIHQESQDLKEDARQRYMASRLKREQMRRVLEDIGTPIRIEQERRTQSLSDDRFLARRRWTDRKRQEISVEQIKNP